MYYTVLSLNLVAGEEHDLGYSFFFLLLCQLLTVFFFLRLLSNNCSVKLNDFHKFLNFCRRRTLLIYSYFKFSVQIWSLYNDCRKFGYSFSAVNYYFFITISYYYSPLLA